MRSGAAVVILLLVLLPGLAAASYRIPTTDMVSGHTTYINYIHIPRQPRSEGLPTDFAAVAGHFALHDTTAPDVQRECVVWFNGQNLDQRPPTPANGVGVDDDGAFPSDEDEAAPADVARQDYDFDRDVEDCLPMSRRDVHLRGSFAAITEAGDCDPALGRDFRFRGHLDFVDPNGIYHEVQEYSYVCPMGGPRNLFPNPAVPFAPGGLSEAIDQYAPSPMDQVFDDPGHCGSTGLPGESVDPENGSAGRPERFFVCQSRVQAFFTEMLWLTPIHETVWDPTIQADYSFAAQIDTCDGSGCTDGSRDSFDDTSRSRVSHRGPPATAEETMRGNSYDADPASDTSGTHRTNCRHVDIRWQRVSERPGRNSGDSCYPEDHRTAQIDIYALSADPTGGLWNANANGLTGQNVYSGHGVPTGPTWVAP